MTRQAPSPITPSPPRRSKRSYTKRKSLYFRRRKQTPHLLITDTATTTPVTTTLTIYTTPATTPATTTLTVYDEEQVNISDISASTALVTVDNFVLEEEGEYLFKNKKVTRNMSTAYYYRYVLLSPPKCEWKGRYGTVKQICIHFDIPSDKMRSIFLILQQVKSACCTKKSILELHRVREGYLVYFLILSKNALSLTGWSKAWDFAGQP